MKLEYNITPGFMMGFNAIVAGLGALLGAGSQFTTIFGTGEANKIIASISLAFLALGAIGTALSAGSSTKPGPLATPDLKDVAKTLFFALLLGAGLMIGGGVSFAQVANPSGAIGGDGSAAAPVPAPTGLPNLFPNLLPTPVATTGDPVVDAVNSFAASNKAMLTKLTTAAQSLLALFGTGDTAVTESLQYPTLQDGNGHDCAVEGKRFSQIIHDHPLALTGHFIDDLENSRIVFAEGEKICGLQQCQSVFNELSAQISKFASAINGPASTAASIIPAIGTAAGAVGTAATVAASQDLFTQACSTLAAIPLVAPSPTPKATAAPTPVPSVTPTATPSP